MGKGGAQLGKTVKGKSKEKKERTAVRAEVTEQQLNDDIRELEEYERLARLAEANRKRLKALQQQEEENTRLNRMRLTNLHRTLMRAQKVESLLLESEIMSQNHERDVQRRDALVRMLSADLDDMEEQYQAAQRTHMTKRDQLTGLHLTHLAKLESEFERDLGAVKDEYETEARELARRHETETAELRGIIAAVEADDRKRADEARQAHETEREEIRNKNLEDINMLRINLENKIEDLAKQFDTAHQQYVDHTDQANKHFKKLVKKDKTLNKQIDSQKHKIEKLQARLSSWKKTIEQNEKECRARNEALRAQKDAIQRHCHELKARMKRFRDSGSRRLTELTVMSRQALKKNEGRLEQAERILTMAELCEKYETEREKVLPFTVHLDGPLAEADGAQAEGKQQQQQQLQQQSAGGKKPEGGHQSAGGAVEGAAPAGGIKQLDRFYQRYNKVLLDKLAIEEERSRLARENADLQALLKEYLDGVSITPDAVDHANPLLVVNGRVNLAPDQPVRRASGRPSVVEAAVTVRSYAQHSRPVQ